MDSYVPAGRSHGSRAQGIHGQPIGMEDDPIALFQFVHFYTIVRRLLL